MKQLLLLTCIFFLFVAANCNRESGKEVTLDERCMLDPDPGPCRGSMPRFYFDREEGICKQFIYGGCQGVVPFEDLESCEAACGVK